MLPNPISTELNRKPSSVHKLIWDMFTFMQILVLLFQKHEKQIQGWIKLCKSSRIVLCIVFFLNIESLTIIFPSVGIIKYSKTCLKFSGWNKLNQVPHLWWTIYSYKLSFVPTWRWIFETLIDTIYVVTVCLSHLEMATYCGRSEFTVN